MEGFMECPRCGGLTPKENTSCIYCGETLPLRVGPFSALRSSLGGLLFALLALLVVLAFLAWLL